jgi:hypothetical protein
MINIDDILNNMNKDILQKVNEKTTLDENTKICTNINCVFCGQPQLKENFNKRKDSKDGLFSWCKSCLKIHNKKYKSTHREQIRKQENEAYYKNENIKNCHKEYRNRLANYDQFNERLSKYEETRQDPLNPELLQVKCMHCKSWFTPRTIDCQNRLLCINSEFKNGESRFYCSDGCKKSCPIFWTITKERTKNNKVNRDKNLERPIQKELREIVLERDEYACVKCGASGLGVKLICHHIDSVSQNPIESADVDNCITVCQNCDKRIHSQPGCRPYELSCKNKYDI